MFCLATLRRRLPAWPLLLPLLCLLMPMRPAPSQPPTAAWKQVHQAIEQGLPKTAIQRLETIIESAGQQGDEAEQVRAIALKTTLEAEIEGGDPAERIERLEPLIEAAESESKQALLRSIQANWFWDYFQRNRWQFQQRSEVAGDAPANDDFRTWSLPRILDHIDGLFQTALARAEVLQAIPVTQFDALLEAGNAPDAYRPTLYDFLAYDALDFYTAGEQAGSLPQGSFDLTADSPIFDDVATFLGWEPDSKQSDAPELRAIQLYQELLRFHAQDDDPAARIDADLARLQFGKNVAHGETQSDRFIAALDRFVSAHEDHPISARAISAWAEHLHRQGDWVAARQKAILGRDRFPESIGGKKCFNLIQQIEARDLAIQTEQVWTSKLPAEIQVAYRNLSKVHFKLVRFDDDDFLAGPSWRPNDLTPQQQQSLHEQPAVRSWTFDLPATDDYQQRTEVLDAPQDVPPGTYYLIASANADFSKSNNRIAYTAIWFSELTLVTRTRNGEGTLEGFVLEAHSGQPVSGATVRAYKRDRNRGAQLTATTQTDADGLYRFDDLAPQNRSSQYHLLAESEGRRIGTFDLVRLYRNARRTPTQESIRFFTDRALYRPGQTIRYKAICSAQNVDTNEYRVLGNQAVTIVLRDVNNEEIARREHRSNDYGSLQGSFTVPDGRGTGRMTLQSLGPIRGATNVQVEEYKRPKFRVEVDSPAEPARLGAEVNVVGKATAYTGAAIDGATVRYRVVRETRFPDWWTWRCWWMPPLPSQPDQEIATGETTTAPDGSFEIAFTARPDEEVLKESQPTFRYTVTADVTDTTGETRSGQTVVRLGYTALQAELNADDWQTVEAPVNVRIRTETLNGEGAAAEGTLAIYSLQQPEAVARPPLFGKYQRRRGMVRQAPDQPDPTNPASWQIDRQVAQQAFTTDPSGTTRLDFDLPAGIYRGKLTTADRFGNVVHAFLQITVIDPASDDFPIAVSDRFAVKSKTVQPGETLTAVWGSGYEAARAFIEIEHRGERLKAFWTEAGTTQALIELPITEAMRGGLTIRTTMVRENRAALNTVQVEVPWTNKQLTLRWERFVSKLKPGAPEKWTAIIEGPNAQAAAAECVATLYDASLDAYLPHDWPRQLAQFFRQYSNLRVEFVNRPSGLQIHFNDWRVTRRDSSLTYRHYPPSIMTSWRMPRAMMKRGGGMGGLAEAAVADRGEALSMAAPAADAAAMAQSASGDQEAAGEGPPRQPDPVDLGKVSARKNLQETAFFFPQLVSNEAGRVEIEFTMPEALTEWRFMAFAHDRQLRTGFLEDTAVTAKDLMVQPNPPRFVRAGDRLDFTVKVSNQSPTRQTGKVRLTFADARSGDAVDDQLDNRTTDRDFSIPAGQSQTLTWSIDVPDDLSVLTYKAVGSTGRLADGEEGFLPVLSRKVMVTESLALPIRGAGNKTFTFDKLQDSHGSTSIDHKVLTVQMVSNPSWYAVLSLPYLMEYPHRCSEQVFNRLYANALGRHLVTSNPRIADVFAQWRGTPALDSPLEKNQELKDLAIEATPWLRDAKQESQARRDVGNLLDLNHMNQQLDRAADQLAEMQNASGLWPWFPGGRDNEFITLYITTGYGRLRHLSVPVDVAPAVRSLAALDRWMHREYESIQPGNRGEDHLKPTIALYLYGRSFFLEDQPIADAHAEAIQFWQEQARRYWVDLGVRQSQGHIALALQRFGDRETPAKIINSLRERAIQDEELGMFWRDGGPTWWWYTADVETQAIMIEAFDEIAADPAAVEACKVWLLKQKQTQRWESTKATADACYALLLRGTNLLASTALVRVQLGEQTIEPEQVEAGTGFYQERFVGSEIKPSLADVSVRKVDPGVAWGSVHWQYLEDLDKVTASDESPLQLTKRLFVRKNTPEGPQLTPVEGPIEVGDELVVRVILRSDRDMEYLHLKDHRGSGTEPVNVLSRYRFQDGLAYYESTRDTASHFFIDYLPRGTYVFEYATGVQLAGEYQTGYALIECMYAPEFSSHSESLPLKVK